jgi:hypothetical protein
MRYSKASEPLLGFIFAMLAVLVPFGDAVMKNPHRHSTSQPQLPSIFVADAKAPR